MLASTRFTILGLNPNDVGTFIVMVILSLPILLNCSKSWLWMVWPMEVVLLALLVGTGSRGNVLALMAGLFVFGFLLWRSNALPRGWKSWSVIALWLVLGVAIGLVAFPKGSRLGRLDVSTEASAGRRMEVWSAVPAMIAASPGGWGFGNSAQAYEQWFEPMGEPVQLKHLLSSHFTWLVEVGWPLRWLYLALWLFAFALILPDRNSRLPLLGAAVLTAFFVALIYNASGKWWNWPLPVSWLILTLILRLRHRSFPSARYYILAVFVSGLILGSLFIWEETKTSSIAIHSLDGGNIVLIGTGKPDVAILSPSKNVLGDFYGQKIRKYWPRNIGTGSVIVVSRPDSIAIPYLAECRLFVISGGDETALYKWRLIFTPKCESNLLLINTRLQPDDWVKVFSRVLYCHGDFFGDPYYRDWRLLSSNNPALSIENIPGCGAYVADWRPLLGKFAAK